MPTRAADDFEAIRTRLEQLKKEQEEADRAQPQEEPKADTYAEYDGCESSNEINVNFNAYKGNSQVQFYKEYTLPAYRQYIKALAEEFKL